MKAFVRLTSISVALQLVETLKDRAKVNLLLPTSLPLKSKLPHRLLYLDRLNHITWL